MQLIQSTIKLLIFICLWSCGSQETKYIDETVEGDPEKALVEDLRTPEVPPARFAWQKPSFVIEQLGDIQGKVIADIGAGTGYFTFRLLKNAEKVIAVDIDQNMLDLIDVFRENLDSLDQNRVETRMATNDDPGLNKEEIDAAIIINTIGFIKDRRTYMINLKNALKEGGEVTIVDFKMKRIPEDIATDIEFRVSILELENLLTDIGYEIIGIDDISLNYQYLMKIRKPS